MDNDDFYLKIAYALSGCQLIERELKLYITEALELAKKCIGDKMPFYMSGKDYSRKTMGELILIFKKLSNNDELAGALEKFTSERNILSHKGITNCLDYEGELDHSTASEMQDRLDRIQTDAQTLRIAIHEEANKFRGHLWFDDVTKDS